MKITLSPQDAEHINNGLVPEGDYLARVKNCEEKESKAGRQMVVATYEVANGPCRGMEVREYIVLEFASWKVERLAKASGVKVPAGEGEFDFDPDSVIGSRVALRIAHRHDKDDPEKIWPDVRKIQKPTHTRKEAPVEPDLPAEDPVAETPVDDETIPF